MARRRKKDDRHSSTKVVSTIPSPARPRDPSPGRGTFAVAKARRRLAEDIPMVVMTRRPEPIRRQTIEDRPGAVEPLRLARPPMPRPKALQERDREPLTMRNDLRDDRTCKSRPSRTSGSGGSRPFVPWCSHKG